MLLYIVISPVTRKITVCREGGGRGRGGVG